MGGFESLGSSRVVRHFWGGVENLEAEFAGRNARVERFDACAITACQAIATANAPMASLAIGFDVRCERWPCRCAADQKSTDRIAKNFGPKSWRLDFIHI